MLEGRSYVPFLHLRLAEMRALRELPSGSKNQIFPIVRLRPWLNSKSLDRAFEVIAESFGDRYFAIDLDPFKYDPANDKPAYQEFAELFNSGIGFQNYYEKVESLQFAVPVLRLTDEQNANIEQQLEFASNLGRGLVIRIDVRGPHNFGEILAACATSDCESIVYVIDAGWGRDILERSAVCAGLVQAVLALDEDAEVVVSSSSFPDSFAGLGQKFSIPINERLLFNEVRRQFNVGRFFYGDWGSTRPPTEPVPMKNVPRIDTAGISNWNCWRSEGNENYHQVAARLVTDPDWDGSLGIWAEYMIEATVAEADPSIKSPAMAAAVRVNMHMHFQANFDSDGLVIGDVPVGDDF